jgi:Caspase domain
MANRALLLANWKYNDRSGVLTPLRGPEHDLRAMQEALTDQRFGLFDDVQAFDNLKFADMGVTFFEFLEGTSTDDRLLLYFSGHGERRPDERLALCGVDTVHSRLEATSFDAGVLRNWIEGPDYNRAPSTVVILDCCYAGQMTKGSLPEQTLVGSLGPGTMVLASGANQPAKDAVGEGEPSPFTAALTRIMVDPQVQGNEEGWLTVETVYDRLTRLVPPLVPKPQRSLQGQGTLALAKRQVPAAPKRPELKGYQAPDRIEVVELTFGPEAVAARWDTGASDSLELVGLDPNRQTAVRRLSQLADAVIRVPEYAEDTWYQQAVEKAWNCVGVNLFETALPPPLRDHIRSRIDRTGRSLLKIRLVFEQGEDSLEPYPWEYLQVRHGASTDPMGGDESLALALQPGLLIERVAPGEGPAIAAAPTDATPTVGVLNCLREKYAPAADRVANDLDKLPNLNLVMDLRGRNAGWGRFLDDVAAQVPRLLLLFAPLKRGPNGVEVGFAANVAGGEPEWHLGHELTRELRHSGLAFDAVMFLTFAAKPGQDSFRGTLELARTLAQADIGPVVFACHAPGFEGHVVDPEREPFPVLFADALTRKDMSLDQAFYYAKTRVARMGSKDVRRTFGVPGYYVSATPEPQPARSPALTPGGQSTQSGQAATTADSGGAA